jgi:hypothetical protein
MPSGSPYPPYALLVARDAFLLWGLVRLASLGVKGWSGPSLGTGLIVIATVLFLVRLEARRNHEPVLHGNLGTPAAWVLGIAAAVAVPLEIGFQAALFRIVG